MNKEFIKELSIDIIVDIIAGIFMGIGTYCFAAAFKFPMVGFTGLALIIYQLSGLPVGIGTIVLNIPFAILSYRELGKKFLLKSIKSIVITSLVIDVVAKIVPVYQGDHMLAAICTGIISATGYSLIFMRDSSTGGADFIMVLVHHFFPHFSLGKIALVIDSIIIVLGVALVSKSINSLIYGLIIAYLVAVVLDKAMDGLTAGKLIMIICDKPKEMAKEISDIIDRGSTYLKAVGSYTEEEKNVVMCACRTKEVHIVRQSAKKLDPTSFVIILDSNEVAGEGFRRL
ncbi:MAG: YitT family protein [Lachnospiraceae bacterium]|nr:MAG: YitT family protein [Lachnospiraceae bacterium]